MKTNDKKRANQSKFVVLPKAAIDRLLKHQRAADLISLFTFYNYTATWQGTNQPRATIAFVAKGLKWGKDKLRRTKSILVGMELIEDVTRRNAQSGKTEGWYIRLNFFPKLKNHPPGEPEGGSNHRVVFKPTNACSLLKKTRQADTGSPWRAGTRSSQSSDRTRRSCKHSRRAAPLPDGFDEEEQQIIALYHKTVVASDPRWHPVNQFSEKVRFAISDWLADHRGHTVDDMGRLFLAAANADDSVIVPKTRSIVRLLFENQYPDFYDGEDE